MQSIKKILAGGVACIFGFLAIMVVYLAQIPNPESPITEWPRYVVLMAAGAVYGGLSVLFGLIATNK
jgi:hypothetical protein